MAGPASPSAEGPTYEPPTLPPGWIAQWDSTSKKYYYVQLSTGVSQWDTPTQAAPGSTPAQGTEHPYGVPSQPPEVITHPDGSQTVKHPDGRLEPLLPGGGSRGTDGPSSDRGLGSFATNALLNQFSGGHGKPSQGGGSGGLGGLAGQVFSGLSTGGGSSHGGSSHSGGNPAGKLVGALASSLFSSGNKHDQPQNYHGGQSHQSQQSGGFAGSVMGGVANMFGGNQGHSNQNFGYSNSGQSGGYSGQAPPTSYQAPTASTPAYSSSSPSQHQQQHGTPSYPPPPTGTYGNGTPHHQGQPNYAHNQQYPQQQSYGSPSPSHQPQYGSDNHHYQAPSSSYNPSYGNPPPQQSAGQPYAPPVPSGTHPHHGQYGHSGSGGYPAGNW